MTTVRISVEGERVGPQFERIANRFRRQVLTSIRQASNDVSEEIVKQGSADIGRATPNFGKSARWTKGLHAPVTEGGGNIKIGVTHDVPYWLVHEKGAVIKGKPFLWIPITAKNWQFVKGAKGPGGVFKKRQVTIPKRFHVFAIARRVSLQLREFYNKRFAANG